MDRHIACQLTECSDNMDKLQRRQFTLVDDAYTIGGHHRKGFDIGKPAPLLNNKRDLQGLLGFLLMIFHGPFLLKMFAP